MTLLAQISPLFGQEELLHIVKSLSSISPNPAPLEDSVKLKITIYNLNQSEISCTLKISPVENISIYPSGELNVTVLGKGHGYE